MESSRHCSLSRLTAGFTIVEMLVVLAIIGVITAIVFTNQGAFNKTAILTNTAYDVALSLRDTENYGLGGRAVGDTSSGYGVRFSLGTPKSYIVFADTYPAPSPSSPCHPVTDPTVLGSQSGNCAYDTGQDVSVGTYTLGNNITVSDFCAHSSGGWSCAAGGGGFSTLDVVFARPNPDPFIGTDGAYSSLLTEACVTLAAPEGSSRSITITGAGGIIINQTACP